MSEDQARLLAAVAERARGLLRRRGSGRLAHRPDAIARFSPRPPPPAGPSTRWSGRRRYELPSVAQVVAGRGLRCHRRRVPARRASPGHRRARRSRASRTARSSRSLSRPLPRASSSSRASRPAARSRRCERLEALGADPRVARADAGGRARPAARAHGLLVVLGRDGQPARFVGAGAARGRPHRARARGCSACGGTGLRGTTRAVRGARRSASPCAARSRPARTPGAIGPDRPAGGLPPAGPRGRRARARRRRSRPRNSTARSASARRRGAR